MKNELIPEEVQHKISLLAFEKILELDMVDILEPFELINVVIEYNKKNYKFSHIFFNSEIENRKKIFELILNALIIEERYEDCILINSYIKQLNAY